MAKTNYVKSTNNEPMIIGRMTNAKKELLVGAKLTIQGWNFNGYGYTDYDYTYFVSDDTYKKFVELLNTPIKQTKPKKSFDDTIHAWCKRLAKLTGIDIEEAMEIANEKLEYKQDKIEEMQDRQYDHYSTKREKLINKMERENPLRRIKDAEHAYAVLSAHDRHTKTDYEYQLELARESAERGEINKSEIKEQARKNYNKLSDKPQTLFQRFIAWAKKDLGIE